MRKIGRLDDAASAATLSDALQGRGVDVEVREEDGGLDLWVRDDARLAEAKAALAAFREDPAPFEADAARGRAQRAEVARKDAAWREQAALARTSVHGADGHGWITLAIAALTMLVAFAGNLGQRLDALAPLFLTVQPAGALLPEVRSGELWRLFTPILVHFGTMHLLFDLSAWGTFARRVEVRKGLRFTLLFVLTSAAISNVAEVGWASVVHPERVALVGGLSGVIYGLAGYVFTKGRIDPLDELQLDEGNTRLLVVWLLLGFTGVLGPIANLAHLSGLIWGVLYAYADVAWYRWRRRRR